MESALYTMSRADLLKFHIKTKGKVRKLTKICDFLFLFLWIYIKIETSDMHKRANEQIRYCEKCILKWVEGMEYDI